LRCKAGTDSNNVQSVTWFYGFQFVPTPHELSRSGEPWHRIERLEHIVGWFDKWMMGAPHPEFDIPPGEPQ
jgi:hypothetical protein